MSEKKFVTAINCMDGRVQLPVFHWMQNEFGAEYVDMITAAGPEKVVLSSSEEVEYIKAKVRISHEAHGSEVLAIAGHHDCAGNPVDRDKKLAEIAEAVDAIKSWGFPIKVIGLYVNENWQVETVIS
ncbi:carbonic anhydrase [Bacillus marinisedimentorum]|uniref:carbonic anhydrase n=1 Tax=Bacillus marinisedimentorum TaxID=1821260 RepID=UPI0007DE92D1|nr:carbonic anhydrase [Bacillus marinisedimentorum]